MMQTITPEGQGHSRRSRRLILLLALGAFESAFYCNFARAEEAVDSQEITRISIEKDCFGCSTGERLTLQRDGQVSLTLTGKARHRTQDQSSVGVISPADFEALVRLTLAQGFFAMQAVYEDPQSRDGAWTTFTLERRGGATQQVFRRESEGPAGLDVIAAALRTVQARISFQ